MSKIKNNFLSKLHLGCSEDPISEKLNLIHFKNGRAYCANGHIAIVQDLDVHELTEECIQNLEGKFIHRLTFIDLLSYKEVYFKSENIVALTKSNTEVIFNYYPYKEQWIDVEAVVSEFSMNPLNEIAFNPMLLKKIDECLVKTKQSPLHLRFQAKNKPIVITTVDENSLKQKAILMPFMTQNDIDCLN